MSYTNWTQVNGELPKRPWVELDERYIEDKYAWKQVNGELPKRPWVELDERYIEDKYAWKQQEGYLPFRPWPQFPEMPYEDPVYKTYEVEWTESMQQTFEYYVVDPETWHDTYRLDNITQSSIRKDSTSETLGSSSLDTTEMLDENYIRTYLVIKQNGIESKECLGTYLYMTSGDEFDGVIHTYSMTGYTPLIELKENLPPIGYFIPTKDDKDNPILIPKKVAEIIEDNCRAPSSFESAINDYLGINLVNNYVANPNDTWLSVVTGLLNSGSVDKYCLTLSPRGEISLEKYVDPDSMNPIWTYDDGNSSILLPDISLGVDLYGIPNVVEVVYSGDTTLYSRVVNDDPDSITSTVTRKREIVHRVTDVNLPGTPTQESIDEYARLMLESVSTIQNKLTYSHAYCPVRIGDCVLLDYKRAGLDNIKARVIAQEIKCTAGCTVSETAVYTTKLWRAD